MEKKLIQNILIMFIIVFCSMFLFGNSAEATEDSEEIRYHISNDDLVSEYEKITEHIGYEAASQDTSAGQAFGYKHLVYNSETLDLTENNKVVCQYSNGYLYCLNRGKDLKNPNEERLFYFVQKREITDLVIAKIIYECYNYKLTYPHPNEDRKDVVLWPDYNMLGVIQQYFWWSGRSNETKDEDTFDETKEYLKNKAHDEGTPTKDEKVGAQTSAWWLKERQNNSSYKTEVDKKRELSVTGIPEVIEYGESFDIQLSYWDEATSVAVENGSAVHNGNGNYTITPNKNAISGGCNISWSSKYKVYKVEYWIYDCGDPSFQLLARVWPKEEEEETTGDDSVRVILKSNVTVNNYINKIEDSEDVQYKDARENKYGGTANDRESWDDEARQSKMALAEIGEEIEYVVKFKNNKTVETKIKAEMSIPKGITPIEIKREGDETAKSITANSSGATIISGEQWPGADKEGKITLIGNNADDENSTEDGNGTVTYIITGRISAGEYSRNVCTATITQTYMYDEEAVNEGVPQSSSDYYECKKYNVRVNTYITGVTRADNDEELTNEKLSLAQDIGIADRSLKAEADKKTDAVCIENGDRVVYNLRVENQANETEPYYSPQVVSATIQYTLPTTTAKIVSVDAGDNITHDSEHNEIIVTGLANDSYYDIQITIQSNSDNTEIYGADLRTFKAEIVEVKNYKNKTNIENNAEVKVSEDYFRIKEYNVALDTYILKAEHVEARGGTDITYAAGSRMSEIQVDNGVGDQDETKANNPVYVEYGDRITYIIKVYNTTDDTNYNVGRNGSPYYAPQNVYVPLKITLPNNTEIQKNINIGRNASEEIELTYIVEAIENNEEPEIKAEINGEIKNINGYAVKNNSARVLSTDKYKISSYSATLDQYIYSYDATMAKYNNANGFTTNESEGFTDGTAQNNNYSSTNPLELEKYETVIIATKVTNTASGGEAESDATSYAKYNTRVRPTIVNQTLDSGLTCNNNNHFAIWHKADKDPEDITSSIEVTQDGNTYKYKIKSDAENIILSPDEYIIYYTIAEVSASNMRLDLLKVNSAIDTLTNVNRNASNPREVTNQNTEPETAREDENYMKLKDLVIAGTVWLDANEDGYSANESGMSGITVKLYKTGQNNAVATTTTDTNGRYSFGRQAKASGENYIKYYVEFEYDGVMYKATDIYGGDSDGVADGKGNLIAESTNNWRQAIPGAEEGTFPGTTAGKTEYLTDSNAYEFDDVRNNFNSAHQTIGYNKSYTGFGEDVASANTLSYTKDGHISTFASSDSGMITARSFIKQNSTTTAGVNKSDESNTNYLFLFGYSETDNQVPETEYLKFINLGLVEREKVDMSIVSDVTSVKTTINGEEMTYKFNQNDADPTQSDYNNQTNAYKLNSAYNLGLYKTDYNYKYNTYYASNSSIKNYKEKESELTAEVKYRIKITNNDIAEQAADEEIKTAINEVAIYYDKNFVTADTASELLQKQITVKQKNSQTGLLQNQTVNAIKVYYGTQEQLDSGDGTDIRNHISFESKYRNQVPSDIENEDYKVLYLSGTTLDNAYLSEGESKYIEITFTIDKDNARILKLANDDMGLELITEISAYTTQYTDSYKYKPLAGKYAGLIDRDSNPGNLGLNGVEDYDKYEDDTYKAGIRVKVEGSNGIKREIKGKVWDDARNSEIGSLSTGVQYIGNGNLDDTGSENDKPVSGVKVSLIEVVQTQAVDSNGNAIYREYPAKDSEGNAIQDITDANGNYTLKGYMPGYYKVRFDYGYDKNRDDNILYNGQDYKSTQYYNEGHNYSTDNIGGKANFNYFDKINQSLVVTNKSDAQDDEIRRLNVNSYSETMTAAQAKVFAEPQSHKQALIGNTHMYAESAIFYVKPENVDSAVTNIIADSTNIGSQNANATSNFNTKRKVIINNLDFGLEYRPEASIILDKQIERIELITSDDKSLVELYFKDQDGKRIIDEDKSKGYENVQFIQNTDKDRQGYVYINMDTDILEGAIIKVEYAMDSQNNSEVDRINVNLDNIKYEKGANAYGATYKVYSTQNASSTTSNVEYTYNANATAARLLASQYYAGYAYANGTESYSYQKKIKKSYKSGSNTSIANGSNTINLKGTGYYGMYLGQAYYTGSIGNNDTVAKLKVNHILDYIDNDFTFDLSENNTTNRTWQTTTSKALSQGQMLDFNAVLVDNATDLNLVDRMGVKYDTENRSNLALSVDNNKSGIDNENITTGNASLSRFLNTKKVTSQEDEYTGTITALTTKVLSANDVKEGTGLSYENIAEIIQYTTLTGRRTSLPDMSNGGGIVGNANVSHWNGYNTLEDDTDASEIITVTPPTGVK